jgi:hypothetical protein
VHHGKGGEKNTASKNIQQSQKSSCEAQSNIIKIKPNSPPKQVSLFPFCQEERLDRNGLLQGGKVQPNHKRVISASVGNATAQLCECDSQQSIPQKSTCVVYQSIIDFGV